MKNVKEIGEGAFELCENLKNITIPEDIIEIRKNPFRGCPYLQKNQNGLSIFKDMYIYYREIFLMEHNNVSEYRQKELIDSKDFSMSIFTDVKYYLLWQMFVQTPDDPELLAYIKKNFNKMFTFAIHSGLVKAVETVCKKDGFLNKKNISKFIDIIADDLKTNDANKDIKVEMQKHLIRCKAENKW